MSLIKKIILLLLLALVNFSLISFAEGNGNNNVDINNVDSWDKSRNTLLNDFWKNKDEFFGLGNRQWWQGIYYTLIGIAYNLKNVFFWFATIFYLIVSIKLLVSENSEDQVAKFKNAIVWVTIWLMVMQIAYAFSLTLYAKQVWESLAFDLINNIVNPLIGLLEVLASIFFIAIAIFAFYRMVTANGKEEEVTRAKMSILYAIIWFILIKIAWVIVSWVYWKLECSQTTIAWFNVITTSCIWEAQINNLSSTIMQIINWANWFIWIITVLLIIYAWFNILFSAGDEEKIKKAKSTILYIAVWLLLLSVNYLLLTFFIIPETII